MSKIMVQTDHHTLVLDGKSVTIQEWGAGSQPVGKIEIDFPQLIKLVETTKKKYNGCNTEEHF